MGCGRIYFNMTITIDQIKALREKCGAGVMECRQVLEEFHEGFQPARRRAEPRHVVSFRQRRPSMHVDEEHPDSTVGGVHR